MSNVIVIGGGAAGMMAAYAAALCGHQVKLIEQNEKLGKKIFITGKGRCNITNAGDMDNLFANVMSNPKFLYSAFYTFNNEQMMSFLEEYGLKMKVERGNRVFPVSDHSSDVIATLRKALANKNVEVFLHTKVNHLLVTKEQIKGVGLSDGREVPADAVIVATGGFSYQTTGATGDGYRFAEKTGHKLVQRTPALVPFEIKEAWVKELQGLSLRNVSVSVYNEKKKLYEDFGEMLFTHFGVSGPLILSASGMIKAKQFENELKLYIDLKPALTAEQLDKRILRDFDEAMNKSLHIHLWLHTVLLFHNISRSFLNLYDSVSSGTYSNKSPGWQSSAAHNLFNVSTFTAFAFPFFRIETFAIVIPSFSESSVTLIFRLASMTSIFTIIAILPPLNCQFVFTFHIICILHQTGKTFTQYCKNCSDKNLSDHKYNLIYIRFSNCCHPDHSGCKSKNTTNSIKSHMMKILRIFQGKGIIFSNLCTDTPEFKQNEIAQYCDIPAESDPAPQYISLCFQLKCIRGQRTKKENAHHSKQNRHSL